MVVFVIIEEALFENEEKYTEIKYIGTDEKDVLNMFHRRFRLAIADMCNKAEGEVNLEDMTFIVKSIRNNDIIRGRIEQHYVHMQEEV